MPTHLARISDKILQLKEAGLVKHWIKREFDKVGKAAAGEFWVGKAAAGKFGVGKVAAS